MENGAIVGLNIQFDTQSEILFFSKRYLFVLFRRENRRRRVRSVDLHPSDLLRRQCVGRSIKSRSAHESFLSI